MAYQIPDASSKDLPDADRHIIYHPSSVQISFHASNHAVEAVLMCLLVRMTYWMLSFVARTVEYEGDHNRNQKVTKTLTILGRVGEDLNLVQGKIAKVKASLL